MQANMIHPSANLLLHLLQQEFLPSMSPSVRTNSFLKLPAVPLSLQILTGSALASVFPTASARTAFILTTLADVSATTVSMRTNSSSLSTGLIWTILCLTLTQRGRGVNSPPPLILTAQLFVTLLSMSSARYPLTVFIPFPLLRHQNRLTRTLRKISPFFQLLRLWLRQ